MAWRWLAHSVLYYGVRNGLVLLWFSFCNKSNGLHFDKRRGREVEVLTPDA